MTPEDLERVKAVAERELPAWARGSWEVHQDVSTDAFEVRTVLDGDVDDDTGRWLTVGGELIALMPDVSMDDALAEFIATFDPPAVLSLIRLARLGAACEGNGLAGYGDDGEMWFQPPADVIAEQAALSSSTEKDHRIAELWQVPELEQDEDGEITVRAFSPDNQRCRSWVLGRKGVRHIETMVGEPVKPGETQPYIYPPYWHAAEARIAVLERERDEAIRESGRLMRENANLQHHYACHRDNGNRLHASLRDMNVALEPFARIGRRYEEINLTAKHPLLVLEADDKAMGGPDGLTVGDFLRAAAQSLGEPDPQELEDGEDARF